jgi:hypothetical protein
MRGSNVFFSLFYWGPPDQISRPDADDFMACDDLLLSEMGSVLLYIQLDCG